MTQYHRKVITIRATDSPNVITGKQLIPGLLTREEFEHRLATWDEVRRCIGLEARFYLGAQLLLFPPQWLDDCERNWNLIRHSSRRAKAIGCDPGEGGACSSWTAVDDLGVIEVRSEKTPDTTDVTDISIEMIEQYQIEPGRFLFDSGGGGKEHADRLRKGVTTSRGSFRRYEVRTIGFGAAVSLDPKRGLRMLEEKVDVGEDAYAYVNRRAQMYHELSQLCDPALNKANKLPGFAIPPGVTTGVRCPVHGDQCLRAQLAVMPKMTDREGRYKLPPKNKTDPASKEKCLSDMIGHSPDESDSLCLAVHAMLHAPRRSMAGAF